jgi:hypothetical protein
MSIRPNFQFDLNNLLHGRLSSLDFHASYMDSLHATWRHLSIFLFTEATTSQFTFDLSNWPSLDFSMLQHHLVLLPYQIDFVISHTWIPSIQPGDIHQTNSTTSIFTCKFFHYYLDLSQLDWHGQTDLIAFKQNYVKVELT